MFTHPTGKSPKTINLVACGETSETFHRMHQVYTPTIPQPDETWSLNKSLRYERADLYFVLDDLVGEARRSERYRAELDSLTVPVITSTIDAAVCELYPALTADDPRFLISENRLFEYPYSEICHLVGFRHLLAGGFPFGKVDPADARGRIHSEGLRVGSYMFNSVPMILLYALFIGVERINIFGADYTSNGNAIREADRANCEYVVGLLRGFGLDIWLTADSTLLNTSSQPFVYGYGARPPVYNMPGDDELKNLYLAGGIE